MYAKSFNNIFFFCNSQEIAKLIQKCLNEADGREIQKSNNLTMAKSIAFPLLGTGPKGLSPEICHVFYQIILLFFLGPTKSLQNAFIIVKPEDSHLIQVRNYYFVNITYQETNYTIILAVVFVVIKTCMCLLLWEQN